MKTDPDFFYLESEFVMDWQLKVNPLTKQTLSRKGRGPNTVSAQKHGCCSYMKECFQNKNTSDYRKISLYSKTYLTFRK